MTAISNHPPPGPAPEQPHEHADISECAPPHYVLRLYVTPAALGSRLAFENLREFCEEQFPGRYELDVIDVCLDPDRARGDQVLAVPTLIKMRPLPVRRLIGNLSNRESMLRGLGLRAMDLDDRR